LTFDELFALKASREFYKKTIHATTLEDVEMHVWDGQHPVTFTTHICPAESRVRVWMVSRLGDVGITDNPNPNGYDARVDIGILTNFEVEDRNAAESRCV